MFSNNNKIKHEPAKFSLMLQESKRIFQLQYEQKHQTEFKMGPFNENALDQNSDLQLFKLMSLLLGFLLLSF